MTRAGAGRAIAGRARLRGRWFRWSRWLRWRRLTAAALAALVLLGARTAAADTTPAAAALLARHAQLASQLRASPFGEPLLLGSREDDRRFEGDVLAEVALPFARLAEAFASADSVCALLLLHLNVHGCRSAAADGAPGASVNLVIGARRAKSPLPSHRMSYRLRLETQPAFVRATLTAPEGPLGTRDYRIVVEAAPLDAQRSVLSLAYAYRSSRSAEMAMGLYLATAGRAKIGFTVVGREPDGRPVHLRGERAALERNVMRYYLAVLAYGSVGSVGSAGSAGGGGGEPPAEAQAEARRRAWFALTERHAAQLHEVELAEYLQDKRELAARAAAGR